MAKKRKTISKKSAKSTSRRRAKKYLGSSDINRTLPPPEKFINRLTAELGQEYASAILTALDNEPITAIRINYKQVGIHPNNQTHSSSLKSTILNHLAENEILTTPIPWCRDGFTLSHRADFTLDPLHHGGAYYVQEPASMIIGETVQKKYPEARLWLDMCAAPGGKSTHIASTLEPSAILIANELDGKRALALVDNVIRMGLCNTIVTRADGADFTTTNLQFDGVSIDAPCSGEGMFRKDKKSRAEWSEGKIEECSTIQNHLLNAAYSLTQGPVIYSTCTFAEKENEHHFRDENINTTQLWTENFSLDKAIRFAPGFHQSEGLFVKVTQGKPKPLPIKSNSLSNAFKERLTDTNLPDFIIPEAIPQDQSCITMNDKLYLITRQQRQLINQLIEANIEIRHFGLEIGTIVGKKIQPSHHLALSRYWKTLTHFRPVELDKQQALQYLKGESLPYDSLSIGYVTLTHRGFALGFGKAIQNRINNLYPKYLRIKKRINNPTSTQNRIKE